MRSIKQSKQNMNVTSPLSPGKRSSEMDQEKREIRLPRAVRPETCGW